MNATPSVPPKGVRASMPVERMHVKPLPPRDPWEVARLRQLFRRQPLPRRAR
jgi:hypothetical protein